ncbi:MAG TPA: hypothetical protein PKL97_10085, partial [Candidatus Omnitrophota bacterium]|nr:hypothetical protein [Candidatus Omnitrophota bacterium]
LNSPEISYFGIEDWKLYETHYRAYLAAERERGPLLEALAGKEAELDREREAVYSVPHNEFHGKVKAFREERLPLLDFLKYLQLTTCDLGLMTDEKYPHLKTLLNSIERDSGIDYEMLDGEIRELCERFRAEYGKRLTAEQAAAFNGRCQEFMTGRGSAAGFLRYLTGLPGEIGAELELSPSMKSLLSHEELLCSIKGTQVFEELEALIEEAEERLSANAEEKALVGKYARLGLLRDMAKLELNREKFERYQASPGEYLELVPDEKMLAGHLEFYRCAAARDEVLQKNLETLMNREKREAAIVILGGFHRSGFEKRLKANGYSFCTITPKIDGLAGAENYDPVMQGNLSYAADLETTLYDAFMRHASLRLVSGLNEPDFRKSLKLWRDRLMMRLSEEGRIAQAAQYTRYVDFLIPEYARKFGRGNSHAPGGADLREAVGVYCDRFKSDVMKRIREEFLSRFGGILPKLTPGDAEVDPEAEGKINPKTRSEDISPSALGISLRNFISGAEAGGFAATVPSGARLIEVSGQEKAASLGETFEFGGRHGEASARGRGVFDIETNGNLVTITDVTPGAAHAGQALTFDPALFRDGQNVRVVANPRSGGAQPERANAALFPYFTVGLGDSFRWLFSIQEWRKKWGGERYISVVLFDTPENRYVAENILNDTADEFIFVKPQFPLVPQGQTRVSGDAYWGRNVHRVAWELLVRDLVERDPAFSEVYGFDTALPRLKTREGVEERFGPFIFHETEQTDEVFRWENNPDTEAAAERFYRARGINPGEDLIVGISMRLNLNGFESFRDTDIRQTLEVIKYLREHYGTERTGKRLVVLLFANGIEPYRTQVETRIGELRRRIRREQYSAKRIRETIETERALIEERLGERARLEAEIERRKKAEGEIPEDEWNELVKRIKEIDDGNKKSNEKISEDSRHLKNAEDRIQFLKEAVRELRTRLRLFGELQNLIDEARDEEGAFRVVDFTNAWDPDKNRDLDRAYSVPEQAAILSGIDLAIGVNSGGLDMALAVGCPGVRIGEFHDQIDFNRFLHASGDGPTISVIGKDPDESTWQKLFAGDEAVRPFRSSSDKSVMEAIRHVMEFLMTGERERASYRVQGSDMFEVNTEKMAESWNLDGSPGPDLETEHPALNSFLNAFSRNGLTGFLSAWTCRGPPESPLIRIPVICRKADQIIEFNMVYGGSKIPSLRRGPEEISPVNVFLLDPSFDVSQWGADELGA